MEELLYFGVHWRGALGICSGILFFWWCLLFLPAQKLESAHDRFRDYELESSATGTAAEELRCAARLRSVVELDIPGVILAIAGLCLILIPLSHFPGTEEGWPRNTFTVMSIVGELSFGAFILWELFPYPLTCFPWRLMTNRNLLGGCLVVMLSAASIAFWCSYYSSYLQVVHDQTIAKAGAITMTRVATSALAAPFPGM